MKRISPEITRRQMKQLIFRLPDEDAEQLKQVAAQHTDEDGKPMSVQLFLESLVRPYLK